MDEAGQAVAVQRMQNMLAASLYEPVTLVQLARQAGYSPYHSARLFKQYTGKSPFEYLRRLRLSKAALKLRDGKARVLDVALDFLFDSQEGFTRAFSSAFGVTPGSYSRNPRPIRLFMPYPVREGFLFTHKGGDGMETRVKPAAVFVQAIERPARKVILRRARAAEDYFSFCNEVDCDIWGVLCSVKEALYEPVGMWLPGVFRPDGTSRYAQGVEVPADWAGELTDGLEVMDLPPCTMLVFQGPAYDDENFEEAIGELWEVMDTYKPGLYGYEWADQDAPRIQLEPQGWRGYIEARPVRRVGGGGQTARIQ